MFKQSEFKGYDLKAIEKFYNKNFKACKKLGNTDAQAHEKAMWFVDYYKHTFRAYA